MARERGWIVRIRSIFDRSGLDDAEDGLERTRRKSESSTADMVLGWQAVIEAVQQATEALQEFIAKQDEAAQRTLSLEQQQVLYGTSAADTQAIQTIASAVGLDSSDIFGSLEGIEAKIAADRAAASAGAPGDPNDPFIRATGILGFDTELYQELDNARRFDYIVQQTVANLDHPDLRFALGELFGGEDARAIAGLGQITAARPGFNRERIARQLTEAGLVPSADEFDAAQLAVIERALSENYGIARDADTSLLADFRRGTESAPFGIGSFLESVGGIHDRRRVDYTPGPAARPVVNIRIDPALEGRLAITDDIDDGYTRNRANRPYSEN